MSKTSSDGDRLLLQSVGALARRAASNKRILALKLDHIGDLAVAFPAFRLLRSRFPDYEITLVCGRWNAELARATGLFDKVIVYDYFPQLLVPGARVPEEPVELLHARLEPPYGIAIDMRVDPETRHLLAGIDAAVKCGVDAFRRFPFLDIALPTASEGDWRYSYSAPSNRVGLFWAALKAFVPLPIKVSLKPAALRLARMFSAHGSIFRDRPPRARLHNAEHLLFLIGLIDQRINHAAHRGAIEIAHGLGAAAGFARKFVCIAPLKNSSWRCWPLEGFRSLVELIVERTDHDVVLLGTAAQAEVIGGLVPKGAGAGRVHVLAGKTSLPDLVPLLQQASLFVGNDSGLAHLAASIGVRVLAIFDGSVEIEEWGPRGARAVTLAAQLACRGCGLTRREECPNGLACIEAITADRVFAEVVQLLAR